MANYCLTEETLCENRLCVKFDSDEAGNCEDALCYAGCKLMKVYDDMVSNSDWCGLEGFIEDSV